MSSQNICVCVFTQVCACVTDALCVHISLDLIEPVPSGSFIVLESWILGPSAFPILGLQTSRCRAAQHNYEKNLLKCSWSPDGSKVAAGSSDRAVYVWDTTSRNLLYKLPGHGGSVNGMPVPALNPSPPDPKSLLLPLDT